MKAKKILKSSLCLVMALSFIGCNKGQENVGKVKLLSMKSSIVEPETLEKKRAILNADNTNDEIDYQYLVLDETQDIFNVTINLENELDYHILDFNLTCDDKDLKVYIGGDYQLLSNQKSINWLGDTNTSYTLRFKSENDNFLSTLKIEKLLYIDRSKESVKYNADVSKNNEVDIYRVNSLKVNHEFKINENGIIYTIGELDSHIENLKVNGEDISSGEHYTMQEDLKFTYDYKLNDNLIINKEYDTTLYLNYIIQTQIMYENGIVTLILTYPYDKPITYKCYNENGLIHEETNSNMRVSCNEEFREVYFEMYGIKLVVKGLTIAFA